MTKVCFSSSSFLGPRLFLYIYMQAIKGMERDWLLLFLRGDYHSQHSLANQNQVWRVIPYKKKKKPTVNHIIVILKQLNVPLILTKKFLYDLIFPISFFFFFLSYDLPIAIRGTSWKFLTERPWWNSQSSTLWQVFRTFILPSSYKQDGILKMFCKE